MLLVALGVSGSVALGGAPAAHAQTQTALAETLFQTAKKLMADGDYASACPKLAESYRLDPGNGTRLALALCYEAQGKTATAWGIFTDVAAAAKQENRSDREVIARAHIATLEPKLSRLVIDVAPPTANVPGLEVKRDGLLIAQPVWGTAVPVDPGDHVIQASAPGKKRWEAVVNLGPKADKAKLSIPILDDEAVVARPAPTSPTVRTADPSLAGPEAAGGGPAKTDGSSGRTIGFVVGGIGIAALGVGAVFGVRAITKSSDAKSLCSTGPCANAEAVSTNSDAKTAARVADITVGAGLVAVAVGAYLVLSAPRSAPASSAKTSMLTPTLDRYGGGLSLQRTW